MKITFLGTKGYIDVQSRAHKRHTITKLEYKKKRILIDCGQDWLGKVDKLRSDAIVITHAHPDHVGGLLYGCTCPVYATEQSWSVMKNYPIENRVTVIPGVATKICGIHFQAFDVQHSLRAPAVGYRITFGKKSLFCAHDLIYIYEQEKALDGVSLYIGDGATIYRSLVRRSNEQLVGHCSIKTQLNWCKKFGISTAYFTHCGTEIVSRDGRTTHTLIHALGKNVGVDAYIAHDGHSIII